MVRGSVSVTRAIEVTGEVSSSAEELYSYFTNDELLLHWLCKSASTEPVQDGDFSLWISSAKEEEPDVYGKFINLIPNQTIQLIWLDRRYQLRSLVTIAITSKDDTIRFDLYQTGLSIEIASDETFNYYSQFWKESFDKLLDHLST